MTDQELIEFYERLQAHEDEAIAIKEKFAELFPVVIPPGPMPIDDKSGAGIDF